MVLTDGQRALLEPLILEVRPRGKTRHHDLRRTIEAIFWRHQNGAKWRSLPAELGPLRSCLRSSCPSGTDDRLCRSWWLAAQTFIRRSRLGVWERRLARAQERGVELGMTFLDGTSIRAHHKAAGAEKRGSTTQGATCVRRLAALVAAMAPKPA